MEENRKTILDLLLNKSALKQDISEDAEATFELCKKVVNEELSVLKKNVKDERIRLNYTEKGKYEFEVYIGSDVLVFQMHTNVFCLPDDNPLWGTKYLKDNANRGYFGIINIYNFLAESFLQNRMSDEGYLIGRIFVNHEKHFMVEGKGQLGFLFRDLENSHLTKEILKHIVQCAFAHALEFDLYLPPYEFVSEVSVMQIHDLTSQQMSTGKRLGFKFQADEGDFF